MLSSKANAATPATLFFVSNGKFWPMIWVILTPFSATSLTTISSPTVSRQSPKISNPQEMLATVAGEKILISLITSFFH